MGTFPQNESRPALLGQGVSMPWVLGWALKCRPLSSLSLGLPSWEGDMLSLMEDAIKYE